MTLPADWMEREEARRAWMAENSLYRTEDEHSSCGVGLVVSIDGKASRKVVENGIEALKAVWHRGAVDADGKTGDGAGIHVEIPQDFFKAFISGQGLTPLAGRLAVGQVFLPRNDLDGQERCRTIVETEIIRMGYGVYGWRQVPVNTRVCGEKANATRPEIEQIMIANNRGVDNPEFDLDLYIIRRRIEKKVWAESINDFYICSQISCI